MYRALIISDNIYTNCIIGNNFFQQTGFLTNYFQFQTMKPYFKLVPSRNHNRTYSQLLFRVFLHQPIDVQAKRGFARLTWKIRNIRKQPVFPVGLTLAHDLQSSVHVPQRESAEREADVKLHVLDEPKNSNKTSLGLNKIKIKIKLK
jgi:hypothetical protein